MENKVFFIYSRKSKFTGKGESIENQIELCRQYIASRYGEPAAKEAPVYEDEGFSGGTLARPQFQKMMRDIKRRPVAAIVVYRLDRISRNIGDFAALIQDLGRDGIDFISIREQFDTASPMGRAMMYIASVFSQLERETIAERIRDNMRELSKTGRWLGGVTPTGYASESVVSVTVDGKEKKACKLRPIPEEIRLVQEIYRRFLETGALSQVELFLRENGRLTKQGHAFTRFSIKAILANPVYMIADQDAYLYLQDNRVGLFAAKEEFDGQHGIMAYNRTLQRPGKANQIRPMEEWIVSVGQHQGAIPGQQWVRVQRLLERNKSKSQRKPRSAAALLSGLLYCGNCGARMRPKGTGRLTEAGKPAYIYLCTGKERSRGQSCGMGNVSGNQLDRAILEETKKLACHGQNVVSGIVLAKKQIVGVQPEAETPESLQRQLAEREAAVARLMDALSRAAGQAAERYIVQQVNEEHKKIEALQKRLDALETERQSGENAEFFRICQILADFPAVVEHMDIEQKRGFLRQLVDKIVWDGKQIHLYFADPKEGAGTLGEDSK